MLYDPTCTQTFSKRVYHAAHMYAAFRHSPAMVHLIGIPLKTTQEVDFLKALKSAVNSLPRLSKSQKSDAIQGLCTLNDLRNRTCVHPKDIFTSTLEELMR